MSGSSLGAGDDDSAKEKPDAEPRAGLWVLSSGSSISREQAEVDRRSARTRAALSSLAEMNSKEESAEPDGMGAHDLQIAYARLKRQVAQQQHFIRELSEKLEIAEQQSNSEFAGSPASTAAASIAPLMPRNSTKRMEWLQGTEFQH